ncbi:hypothetical protein MBLNU459_g4828t1 [Dothideomycetes sp. NU459]
MNDTAYVRSQLLARAEEIARSFEYSPDDAQRAARHFIKQMNEGLHKTGTTLAQIPSYVKVIPNGTETGTYLAVDLGGTNFRSKSSIPKQLMVAKTYKDLFVFLAARIEQFMQENHNDTLSRNREAIAQGIPEILRRKQYRRMGFTFSFTFAQHSLSCGTLTKWTKGFDIPDAVGRDPWTLMARSYTSPGESTTLLGAIFGTGTNGAYVESMSNITKLHKDSELGSSAADDMMVINTEWGSFDNELAVLPNTCYDASVDRDSVNPGDQLFEKRISGMYLGEILRRILLSLSKDCSGPCFDMEIASDSPLYSQWGIDTSFLSVVAADTLEKLSVAAGEIATSLGATNVSINDTIAIQILARAVGRRAARLAGVALAAIIIQSGRLHVSDSRELTRKQNCATKTSRKLGVKYTGLDFISSIAHRFKVTSRRVVAILRRLVFWLLYFVSSRMSVTGETGRRASQGVNSADRIDGADRQVGDSWSKSNELIDIGVDGSLIEFYPGFEEGMRSALRDVQEIGLTGEQRIRIGLAKDGSGVGAALIARAAEEQEQAGLTA